MNWSKKIPLLYWLLLSLLAVVTVLLLECHSRIKSLAEFSFATTQEMGIEKSYLQTPSPTVSIMMPSLTNSLTVVPFLSPTAVFLPTVTPTTFLPTVTPQPTTTPVPLIFHGAIAFAFSTHTQSSFSTSIWIIPFPGATPQELVHLENVQINDLLLSPISNYLAYVQTVDNLTSVWVIDLLTQEKKQWSESFEVTYESFGDRDRKFWLVLHSWSVDGQLLLIQEGKRDVAEELYEELPEKSYVLSFDTIQQSIGTRILDVSWSQTEGSQFLALQETGDIVFYDFDTVDIHIFETPFYRKYDYGGIAWHPNGKSAVVFTSYPRPNGDEVWEVDLEKNEWIKILNANIGLIRYSSDGRFLLGSRGTLLDFEGEPFQMDIKALSNQVLEDSPWLPNIPYWGVVQRPLTTQAGFYDLCFYSPFTGNQVDCPFHGKPVFESLGISPDQGVGVTWSANPVPTQ